PETALVHEPRRTQMPEKSELIITDAEVLDGSGGEARTRDILVQDGRITAVEPPGVLPADSRPVLDAGRMTVAPGFIDVHSHADNAPLLREDDTSKIRQGVTTEVVGNCGFSLAPCLPGNRQLLSRFTGRIFPAMDFDWTTWSELFEATDASGYVTNYAPLVGHGTLRISAMGMDDRLPRPDELDTMGRELEQAMESGVFGMSTGLIYPPAVFSDASEITALTRRLGPDGLYATHMRGEGGGLLDSVAEALQVGRASGCRVHISHLKSSGRPNWGQMPQALELIHAAQADGVAVSKDVYPYTAASTMLTATLPPPWLAGGDEETLERLSAHGAREELSRLIETGLPGWDNMVLGCGWDGVLLSTTASHGYEGLTLAEVAAERGEEPVDSLIHVLLSEELRASMVTFAMNEEDLVHALADTDTVIGSDGLPPGTGGNPHPRMYGTFPRVLGRYVREREVLGLGQAVRRMTSLPAELFKIPDRGRVAPGYVADLVAFDPGRVSDDCDYRDSDRPNAGIAWVMQAGRTVVEGDRFLGVRHGSRLSPAS
ncbi:MAG: N-acyl-D-amino-acid deacylase family protein, partial [Nocardioidaceae bacterium]